jgi:hypothetical protein
VRGEEKLQIEEEDSAVWILGDRTQSCKPKLEHTTVSRLWSGQTARAARGPRLTNRGDSSEGSSDVSSDHWSEAVRRSGSAAP